MIKMFCIAFFVCLSGCAPALVEKLSTGTLQYNEDQLPTLREHPIGVYDPHGVAKRVIITNPFSFAINVKLVCSSLFQADQMVHIRHRSERYLLITAPYSRQYSNSCELARLEGSNQIYEEAGWESLSYDEDEHPLD